jgi:hypothetical protein
MSVITTSDEPFAFFSFPISYSFLTFVFSLAHRQSSIVNPTMNQNVNLFDCLISISLEKKQVHGQHSWPFLCFTIRLSVSVDHRRATSIGPHPLNRLSSTDWRANFITMSNIQSCLSLSLPFSVGSAACVGQWHFRRKVRSIFYARQTTCLQSIFWRECWSMGNAVFSRWQVITVGFTFVFRCRRDLGATCMCCSSSPSSTNRLDKDEDSVIVLPLTCLSS